MNSRLVPRTETNDFFDRLDGTWANASPGDVVIDGVDFFGWNFISQPRLGDRSTGDFHMSVNRMREVVVFGKLGGAARNVGVTGEAGHWEAMKYEVSIQNLGSLVPDGETSDQAISAGEPIHHEMGHFMLKVAGRNQGTEEEDNGYIIRQGTIPRANSFMTTGVLRRGTIPGSPNDFSARPVNGGRAPSAEVGEAFESLRARVEEERGPNFDKPLEWLAKRLDPAVHPPPLRDRQPEEDWVFSFHNNETPSEMAHGQRVPNPIGIGNLLSDFWIGRRTVTDRNGDNRVIDILQYAQKVDLVFDDIRWPHIAVNTLIKQ